jgi:CubicO group peptidase (beta-lactamase class C family)
VITHSIGGLPDYDYFFDRAPDTSIITNSLDLDLIAQNRPALAYSPSTNFYYDNVGFDMGALVIERVTGMSYEEFLRKRFLDPLKMDSTFIRPSRFSNWQNRRTIGYSYQRDSLQLFDIADREGFYGGGNIWFSAHDLYRWGESFYHNQILSQSVIKSITSPAMIGGKLSHLTMGAWYHGKSKNAYYYWGNVAGFYSWVYWDREKQFTIAFTTNTNMPQWVRPLLTSALINIMEDKEYPEIRETESEFVDRSKREQIIGSYEITGVGTAEISIDGTHVNLKVNNGMEYRMYQVDEKTFYVPGYDPWVTFSDLKESKFQRVHWSSTILEADGKRASSN